ncbi:MAG: DUF4350 domain-containing protein, partial [Chloroflexi bacterium]|nr:DUF4350 domain-containing protein [Chloroflexota bacterium]
MKRSSDIWILATLFALLFIGIYFFASPGPDMESKASTTYNPDPRGVKAFYTLLGRLGYPTGRLVRPYTEMPKNAGVLIVVAPHPPMPTSGQPQYASKYYITDAESDALAKWVRNGGTVLFFSNKLKGVPEDFMKTRALGKGHIHAFDSSPMITNKGLRNPKSAQTLVNLVTRTSGLPDTRTSRLIL